jgi:hypothetical protein
LPMTYGSAEVSAPNRPIVGAETGTWQLRKRAQNSNFQPPKNWALSHGQVSQVDTSALWRRDFGAHIKHCKTGG